MISKTFFNIYPVSAHFHEDTIKHFTAQQMASLLTFKRDLNPVIITVHDIIPYMMRDNPELTDLHNFYDRWMDNLAMSNLRRADRIIADSDYTRRMLIEKLGVSLKKSG